MYYYVAEVTGLHSFAMAKRINAKSLTSAKRSASRFIINPIAVKKGNKWTNLW